MRTKKITPLGKLIIFIFVVLTIGGIGYKLNVFDSVKNLGGKSSADTEELYKKAEAIHKEQDAMNVSLDEWVGWKPILDANGGLTTQKGSIYDQLGLKLNISIINDATQSSNALVKGDLNGAGYTINRLAFLYPKFKENNVEIKMPYITNSSTGGDGIIAKKGINRIEDIVGKKVGVPRFSEAQTLVEWLMSKSSLTNAQIAQVRKNMIMFDTPDDVAKAFFAGELDVAGTWQPYLSQAESTSDAHILFSTKDATNIILDGIAFRKDYVDTHKEQVSKFIEGALMASKKYDTEFEAIRNSMPMFSTSSDEEIKSMTVDGTLSDCTTNIQLLTPNGVAQNLFTDMSNVWASIGEKADKTGANKIFDTTFVKELSPKFPSTTTKKVQFTEKERNEAKKQDNNQALLTQRLTINFETGESAIKSESYKVLNEFANTAKILNGAVIQIEGNTDNVGDPTFNKNLSQQRAKAVATYLQFQGLENSRFLVVGNGDSKPIGNNSTEQGKAQNRRTDVYFKVVK